MDAVDNVLGRWWLVGGGRAGGDGDQSSDVGTLVRFALGDTPSFPSSVDIYFPDTSSLGGPWRATPSGLFLAALCGGHDCPGELARPRHWLIDAVRFTVEGDRLVLWDGSGEATAWFDRAPVDDPVEFGAGRVQRASGLAPGLVAPYREQLLGAWEPVPAQEPPVPGWRWQNVEFADDGWWHAFPLVNVSSGRWRMGGGGELLVVHPAGMTQRMVLGWWDLAPWLFPVARAGFDGKVLVLLDEESRELQRLRRQHRGTPVVPDPTRRW